MNLNFYNPATTGSLETLHTTLQDQLNRLDQLSKMDLTQRNPVPQSCNQPQRYYLDCGIKEEWDQFLLLNYGISEKQIFEDYRLFLQAKAELNEDQNKEKLEDMKKRLAQKGVNKNAAIPQQPSNQPIPNYEQPTRNQQATAIHPNSEPINYNAGNVSQTKEQLINASNIPNVSNQHVNANSIAKLDENTNINKGKGSKYVR